MNLTSSESWVAEICRFSHYCQSPSHYGGSERAGGYSSTPCCLLETIGLA